MTIFDRGDRVVSGGVYTDKKIYRTTIITSPDRSMSSCRGADRSVYFNQSYFGGVNDQHKMRPVEYYLHKSLIIGAVSRAQIDMSYNRSKCSRITKLFYGDKRLEIYNSWVHANLAETLRVSRSQREAIQRPSLCSRPDRQTNRSTRGELNIALFIFE